MLVQIVLLSETYLSLLMGRAPPCSGRLPLAPAETEVQWQPRPLLHEHGLQHSHASQKSCNKSRAMRCVQSSSQKQPFLQNRSVRLFICYYTPDI